MSKISDIKEGETPEVEEGDWTIVCMNGYDYGLEHTIGPFSDAEEAVQFALADKRCGEDVHWTIVPNQFPEAINTPAGEPGEPGEPIPFEEEEE